MAPWGGLPLGLVWLFRVGHPRAPEFVPTVPSGPLDRARLHALCAGRLALSSPSSPPWLVGIR